MRREDDTWTRGEIWWARLWLLGQILWPRRGRPSFDARSETGYTDKTAQGERDMPACQRRMLTRGWDPCSTPLPRVSAVSLRGCGVGAGGERGDGGRARVDRYGGRGGATGRLAACRAVW